MSNLLGLEFSDLKMKESVEFLSNAIHKNEKTCKHIVTANPEIVMLTQRDSNLMNAISHSSMITADGIGIILASKIKKQSIQERVTGFDLVTNLMDYFELNNQSLNVFLLGASEENVMSAKSKLSKRYKFVNVKGAIDGFFSEEDVPKIIDEINRADVDLLLVGLGCPKQELFIFNHKNELNVNVSIGCGGTIDVLSGSVKRAPVLFQKTGTEWLYRLVKQPSRIKRQILLPLFLIDVLRYK